LRRVAEETGGGYFELTKTDDSARRSPASRRSCHSQYVLGFSPESLDGKVHKLDVRVKRSGLTARGRKSYLAAPRQCRLEASETRSPPLESTAPRCLNGWLVGVPQMQAGSTPYLHCEEGNNRHRE
jgi:hypothetical protein